MLEAKLKLSMGGAPSNRDTHSVAEVVAGYISDGVTRLSPARRARPQRRRTPSGRRPG